MQDSFLRIFHFLKTSSLRTRLISKKGLPFKIVPTRIPCNFLGPFSMIRVLVKTSAKMVQAIPTMFKVVV